MRTLSAPLGALLLLACESSTPPVAEPAAEARGPATPVAAESPAGPKAGDNAPKTPETKAYGAAINAGASRAMLANVLSQPDQYEGKTVLVEGEVRRACSKKGCWMELAESMSAESRGARVTFKDYGFFVPTDSAGAHAKLEGVVNVKTLKPGQVEHLEQEGAKVAKNADGSAKEVQFVATGVELTR